jgi:serine/threonine protein kinase
MDSRGARADFAPDEEPLEAASTYVSKYRLITKLGAGGTADVYLAVTESAAASFSKLVVVKVPRGQVRANAELTAMFLGEARLAARLNHPNVVQTLDSGHDGERPFIVMEYLAGQPLHRIERRAGRGLPLPMRLAILLDALEGLHYAHEATDFDGAPLGVVHRDVSPQNVFVTYDGQVKIMDFGIARAEGNLASSRHATISGKAAYMAPEQTQPGAVDRRADVFGVGVMLYETLTGERYWGALGEEAILCRLMEGSLPPPARYDAMPPELAAICARALAPRADERYATAEAMQNELEAYLNGISPRPPARKLGMEVARSFDDQREAMKRVIEQHLSQPRAEVRTSVVVRRQESARTALEAEGALDLEVTPALASIATRIGPPSSDVLAGELLASELVASERVASELLGSELPGSELVTLTASRDPAVESTAAATDIEHRRLRGLLAAAMLLLVGSAVGLLIARAHDRPPPSAPSVSAPSSATHRGTRH